MSAATARSGRPPRRTRGAVVDLAAARIERAIARRARYRYVQPRVLPEGAGWKVVSPNCSRNIDPQGGEIDIAWFLPANEGLWLLHARDHASGCWRVEAAGLSLEAALARVCTDPARRFWP